MLQSADNAKIDSNNWVYQVYKGSLAANNSKFAGDKCHLTSDNSGFINCQLSVII